MPIFFGIYSIAPELVPFMFGAQWEKSIPILKILVFLGIINSMSKMYDSVIVSVGRPGLWLKLRTAISISNVFGFFIALHWGLSGVAYAYVIVAYAYLPIYLFTLNRLVSIKASKYFRVLASPITAATLMVCSIFAIKNLFYDLSILDVFSISIPDSTIYLCIFVIVGAISYPLNLALISPKTFRNLLDTINTFRSNRNK
jgi:O-antigen/teichoic acid export membrane protein